MPLIRNCPSCDARLKIRDEAVGRSVTCPRCRNTFPVEKEPAVVVLDPTTRQRSPKPLVFISHAHADRAFVEQTIKPLLENHGVQTWWSQENIDTGKKWENELKAGMAETDWFLVILSPRSEQSQWVHTEIGWAWADKPHRIRPVLMEACNLDAFPPVIKELHFVDFTTNPQAAGRKILADMIRQLNKEARQHEAKVGQLSEEVEKLKEENVEVARRQKEMQTQLDNVLAFDGNWTHLPPRDVPPFRPLAARRAPIVAVANLKGGVGKTTLTANVGATLWGRELKRRVLLIDLDYQANLTQCCLDRKTINRLRQQDRLVQTLFADSPPDPKSVTRCVEPILDDRQRGTDGAIVASDELLTVQEARALTRWLVGQGAGDVRFRLRSLLHSDEVQRDYQFILLDCPPRLTTTCINALTAADYVLVPVLLDEKSTEGAPRLLRWLQARRGSLFPNLVGVGVVANNTRDVNREQEEWDDLMTDCRDAWQGEVCGFDTGVPAFTETAMGRKFPASYKELGGTFSQLVHQLLGQLSGVKA
jgi:cellulose biosynthesis protein BcsQ